MKLDNQGEKNKCGSRRNVIYIILLFLFFVMFLIFIGISIQEFYFTFKEEQMIEELRVEDIVTEKVNNVVSDTKEIFELEETNFASVKVPEKEINFEELKLVNADIYAWIYIPDSDIDYPILQHPTIESYYLNRGIDGKKLNMGSIYTDYINKKDFTDKLTVVYGHNMLNGSMFGELHKFEDKNFFDEHPYIFVYTEEKIFIYEIFAAYEFSNAHLLYNFDLSTEGRFQNFIDQMYTNVSDKSNFRESIEVTSNDHLLTLSTCITGEKNKRYLIQGVLINE